MSWRHFGVFLIVNLAWSTNAIVSKYAVSVLEVPPLFYAAARFGLLAVILAPWLWPIPKNLGQVALAGLLIGALNFGLFFAGLRTADVSSATIVGQIGVPLTLLLSVLMLHERIGWRRGVGIVLTMAGAAIVTWDPQGLTLSIGLVFVALSAAALALGSIIAKQMPPIGPLQFQAWVGAVSIVPLVLASALLERGQFAIANPGWQLPVAVLYSVVAGSILGYAGYYMLLRRYEANLVVPLTLLTPLITIALSVILFGEVLDLRTIAGAGLALTGVLVIVVRRGPLGPLAAFLRNRT